MDQLHRREFLICLVLTIGDRDIGQLLQLPIQEIISLCLGLSEITDSKMDQFYRALELIE